MKIGILTTNYNTWDMTSTCIEHCFKYADDVIDQFIVIDDHSTEKFTNKFNNTTLLINPENIGLVKSLNKGLKQFDTDLIFLFDSDAWPLEEYILKTKKYFRDNPEIGIASFRIEKEDGTLGGSFEAEPSAITLVLGQYLYSKYQQLFLTKPKAITVYTCTMVIRREVLEQIGGFDEDYDWLELDHDICMRASRKGWKIGVMDLRAFHKGSGTPQIVSHRVIRFYKNRLRLLRKFNKYPSEELLNKLIVTRLSIECVMLKLLGRFKFNKDVLKDKVYSRSELIHLFVNKKI